MTRTVVTKITEQACSVCGIKGAHYCPGPKREPVVYVAQTEDEG